MTTISSYLAPRVVGVGSWLHGTSSAHESGR